jgi:hypothetical protein
MVDLFDDGRLLSLMFLSVLDKQLAWTPSKCDWKMDMRTDAIAKMDLV